MNYRTKTIEEMLHLAEQAGIAVVVIDPQNPKKAFVQNKRALGVSLDVLNNEKQTRVIVNYETK